MFNWTPFLQTETSYSDSLHMLSKALPVEEEQNNLTKSRVQV